MSRKEVPRAGLVKAEQACRSARRSQPCGGWAEICSNVCFGGVKRNRLFMTASQSLYAVYVETQGVQVP